MLRRNVLILHAGALGDFVLAWPLILALGRLHPQSRIIVVTHASKGALAEAALRVESADIEQGWHGLFTTGVPLADRAKTFVEGAHAIYTFLHESSDGLRGYAPEAQIVSLKTIPPEGWTRHASDWLLEQLAPHPTVRAAVEQMLRSVNTRGVGTGRSHDGDVDVHPGSGSPNKCWPLERFVELIDRLRRGRLDVRVLLGEAELERFSKDQISAIEQRATVLRRPASFLELFNELRSARALVANDSGPAHLGAMVGVPTVALFGPTDPAVWKPLGPNVTTLREEKLEKLSVAKVMAAVKPLLGE
ncbi:MAG: glycosyltransferase family 9 protein [Tepidisphaeraceae bacterium]